MWLLDVLVLILAISAFMIAKELIAPKSHLKRQRR